jgi:hypothetical protein
MVELIIEETGFPKDRPTLKEFQDSFKLPIQELLSILPGNRIVSGFVVTTNGGGGMTSTEGRLIWNNKMWTIEAFDGLTADGYFISFFEETENLTFNVGTQANPVYEERPGKIRRYAQVGEDLPGNVGSVPRSTFIRGRKLLEWLRAGSIFVGVIVMDVQTAVYHVSFGSDIGTQDYQVLGNFRAANPELSFSRAFIWDVNNRTKNGFDIYIDKATANSIPLIFDYTVIPINRSLTIDEG